MSLPIGRTRAAALAAGLLLGAFALAAGVPACAQQVSGSAWISLEHYSASAMSASDAARVQAQHSAIGEQAAFFGYDLSRAGWQYTQAVCPEIPGYLILHYHRTARSGTRSLFTALVPRGSGRVQVVPVLYGSATPFRSAVGSPRSLSVFNRAVPSSVAEKDLQSGGSWLQLALCYAEIVGAEPRVPRGTDANPALLRAPTPTLLVSEVNHTTSVTFTDRDALHRYTVWNISFDDHGRVAGATATSLADYAARVMNGKEPTEKSLPQQPEPKVIPLSPSPQPKTKPLPQ
ncbi:MAG: hypothetical protein WCA44_14100 [Acidobacteriaceae bacterium]